MFNKYEMKTPPKSLLSARLSSGLSYYRWTPVYNFACRTCLWTSATYKFRARCYLTANLSLDTLTNSSNYNKYA